MKQGRNPGGRGVSGGLPGTRRGTSRVGGQRRGMGPEGECRCPNCGEHISHQRGVPCFSMKCPKCGCHLIRP